MSGVLCCVEHDGIQLDGGMVAEITAL